MNEEKWILATLKRKLLELKSNAGDSFSYNREIYAQILDIIATAEADAILGTPELISAMVDNMPDMVECDTCGLQFEDVEGVDF